MTEGIGQRSGSSRTPSEAGSIRAALPGRPPPVIWATPRSSKSGRVEGGPQVEDRRGVDPGRRQEDLAEGHQRLARGGPQCFARGPFAEGPQQALLVWLGQVEVVFGEERTDERVAVGVEAAGEQAEHGIAGPRRGSIDQPVALDDPGAAAGQVEGARVHQAGCSAVSPPISAQRASRQPSATEPTSSATLAGSSRPTAM